MMQAYLLNFGDNSRVVNDMTNTAVLIGIGQVVECNIHDVHFHMIRRAIASETLMVVPKEVRTTPKLEAIMALLRGIETEPYDELLTAFNAALPPPGLEEGLYRPTRDQIRAALLGAARHEVAAVLRLQSKVTIHEQGDATTRKEVPPPTPAPADKPPEVKRQEGPKPITKKASAKRSKPAKEISKPKVKRERL